MSGFIQTTLVAIVSAIVAVLIGFFVKEPLTRWLRNRQELRKRSRQRIVIRIYQLPTPDGEGLDFIRTATDQNSEQQLYLFDAPDLQMTPTKAEAEGLINASGKRDFIEKVGRVLARVRESDWVGVDGEPTSGNESGTQRHRNHRFPDSRVFLRLADRSQKSLSDKY